MSETPRFIPVTEEQKERARRAVEQLKRDLAEAATRPAPPVTSPGKFTEPLGLDATGDYQPPLTPEEIAHKELIRQRALGGDPDSDRVVPTVVPTVVPGAVPTVVPGAVPTVVPGAVPAVTTDPRPARETPGSAPSATGRSKASGALFGLAYGDALGKPTEFMTVRQIIDRYGPGGPRELTGQPALVTDDTQMTLAVAWALHDAPPQPDPATLERLLRQRFVAWASSPDNNRAPGNACLQACGGLAQGMVWQSASVAGSKGCGANMRVAPVGLVPGYDLEMLASVAQLQAGLTHGHPTALAASELTAYTVHVLRHGVALSDVPGLLRDRCHTQHDVYREDWLGSLWQRPQMDTPTRFIARGWDECLAALNRLDAALRQPDDGGDPCRRTGDGWIAEEALATALWCAIRHRADPVTALARAATTSGDSDSIACLTGAFLGAAHGMRVWPAHWARQIEYGDQLAYLGHKWD